MNLSLYKTYTIFADNFASEVVLSAVNRTGPSHLTSREITVTLLKAVCFFCIIFAALAGNSLVLVALLRFKRLRQSRTNIFLLSLALADLLVALLVMPLYASRILMNGRWIHGRWMCDIFNATDVLLTTASILHLCCISTERYIAVISPLTYKRKMTKSTVAVMLAVTWSLSILISYVPIFLGIYTTSEYLLQAGNSLETCDFVVNPYYAVVSSTTSFWIPAIVMIVLYIRIFSEARKQEVKIQKYNTLAAHHIERIPAIIYKNSTIPRKASRSPLISEASRSDNQIATTFEDIRRSSGSQPGRIGNNGNIASSEITEEVKIRRENKAAKTLGIIVGAFLLCWFPFFLWYTATSICEGFSRCPYPPIVGDILFWVGYFNSTLNPIVYAFYNQAFRRAFTVLLSCNRDRHHSGQLVKRANLRQPNLSGLVQVPTHNYVIYSRKT